MRNRRAFTLVEVVTALAIASFLAASLGSIILVASRAMPDPNDRTGALVRTAAALDQMCAEIRCAKRVLEAETRVLAFTVPDRTGDGDEDTIRYTWSGVPGDPLLREFNGGEAAEWIPDVTALSLSYLTDTHSTSGTTTTMWDSGEVQFAGFAGWETVGSPTTTSTNLTTATWGAIRFAIDRVTLPADLTSMQISRVRLRLRRMPSGTAGATVEIRNPSTAGNSQPGTTVYGTPALLDADDLPTSFAEVDAHFSDVVFADATRQEFVIVIKGVAATASSILQYYNSTAAPADSTVYRWTTTSGSTWLPSSSQYSYNDALFAVYGSYQRQTTTTATVERHLLRQVKIALRAGGANAPRLDTAARALNYPEVESP